MPSQFTTEPYTQTQTNQFIAKHHSHHGPVSFQLFTLAARQLHTNHIAAVAVVARPNARPLDDIYTAELTRMATDRTPNAASYLDGAISRAAWALGRKRLITYIRDDEDGISLKATGWRFVRNTPPRSWISASRDRNDKTDLVGRSYYEKLHPALLHKNEDVWFNTVVNMAQAAQNSGAARTSCPFNGEYWRQRQLWLETYDAATDGYLA